MNRPPEDRLEEMVRSMQVAKKYTETGMINR